MFDSKAQRKTSIINELHQLNQTKFDISAASLTLEQIEYVNLLFHLNNYDVDRIKIFVTAAKFDNSIDDGYDFPTKQDLEKDNIFYKYNKINIDTDVLEAREPKSIISVFNIKEPQESYITKIMLRSEYFWNNMLNYIPMPSLDSSEEVSLEKIKDRVKWSYNWKINEDNLFKYPQFNALVKLISLVDKEMCSVVKEHCVWINTLIEKNELNHALRTHLESKKLKYKI